MNLVPQHPRRWFHLHRLTIALLVLIAGIVIALNCVANIFFVNVDQLRWSSYSFYADYYGWPFKYRATVFNGYNSFDLQNMAINIAILMLMLAAVAILSETLIRKRYYQFHLITALVLMFAAASILALNIYGSNYAPLFGYNDTAYFGWPFVLPIDFNRLPRIPGEANRSLPELIFDHKSFVLPPLFANAFIASVILSTLGILSESLLRRPKPAPAPETPK